MKRDAITFPPLEPTDSLVERMEQIWNLKPQKPQLIEVAVGYVHPDDDSLIDWFPVQMTRNDAAQALRAARRKKLDIGITVKGYCISGAINPAWDYSRRQA